MNESKDTQDAIQPGIYVDKIRGERRTVTDAKNGRVHYTFNDGRSGGSMPIDQWRSRHYEPVPTSTVATEGRTEAWYIMEIRHRNAVIGVAKQYLIDGEPERALAILTQVGNGIGDASAAKSPEGTVLISVDEHNRLRQAAGENPL